jgi:NAD(P)H-hydrate epimerase
LPSPDADSHKYKRGYCTVFAAPALTGATRLSAMAALRVGAGLVTVQCDARGDVYRTALAPEIMVQDDAEPVPEKTTVLLGGPGGLSSRFKDTLLDRFDLPRVIDSGALPVRPDALNGTERTVLTPHEGEFEKLFGAINHDRIDAAKEAAKRSGCIIVLKGPVTFITHPDGRIIVNDRPDPNLATAGTGDVLAGMIAGLIAQGMSPFYAAAAAVWLHSEAAVHIGRGLIASDIIGEIPARLKALGL